MDYRKYLRSDDTHIDHVFRMHWNTVDRNDPEDWFLQYFSPEEMACSCCGMIFLHEASALRLDAMRHALEMPLFVNSAFRCERWNARVGGAENSFHLHGRAFDIECSHMDARTRWRVDVAARNEGFTGRGYYKTFSHYDTGPSRLWVA